MITVSNHNQRITEVDLSTAPEAIKKGKDFFDKAANMYGKSDTIKKTIDLYISKLNEFAGKKSSVKDSAGDAGGAKGKSKKAGASPAAPKASAKRTTPASKPAAKKVAKKSVKSVQSVAKKVATKKVQRKSVAKKPITSSTNNRLAKAPVTVKKLSLELQLIKQVAGMAGKTYTIDALRKKALTIKNHLAEGRIHDHVSLIKELLTAFNKLIATAVEMKAEKVKVTISEGKQNQMRDLVKNATVRVRTEFLAGADDYTEFTDPGYIVREDGMYFVPEDQRATSTNGKWSNELTHKSHMDWRRASKVARYLSMQKGNEKHTFTVKEFNSKKSFKVKTLQGKSVKSVAKKATPKKA